MKYILALTALLLASLAGLNAASTLVVEKLDGPVTATEIQAFKNYLREVPVPTNNLHNAMVYGSGGTTAEALGRMFEICGDQELLDRMLTFTDRMLAARNHPKQGAVIWTGQRELVWPNTEVTDGKPVYSAAENGDVVGHVANAARLILQRQNLWELKVPDGDPFGFGATYRKRALHYVRELDRTIDSFILKWLVHPGSLRFHFPDSPLYEAVTKSGTAGRPVPWNQQMMLNHGFQRLAECHALLGDDADRVTRYDAIVKASVDWFFSQVQRVTVKGHLCYKWAYVAEEPLRHIEDAGHGGEDIAGLYRAYLSRRYGITAAMMEPFANTVLYVMRQPDGKFIPRVDGTLTPGSHPPGGLRSPWLDLCEFAPELFPMLHELNRGRIKSSPDLTASLLWHKHRRLTLPKSQVAP
ncbi:MAG: hypothetical protein WCO56_01005 [Verrucomicrobiota bacterium]